MSGRLDRGRDAPHDAAVGFQRGKGTAIQGDKDLSAGAERGDRDALERLLALHYAEFRKVAARVLRDDGDSLHIQPTELAHEAAIRVLALNATVIRDRPHFLALSARIMRQTLIDEIRRFRANKRMPPEILTQWVDAGERRVLPLDQFDDALSRLMAIDPERGRIVELRFYAGLTMEEIAATEHLSQSTVERRWRAARAWLLAALDEEA